MAKRVYIGVGHGGADNGAVANGFKEDELNLSIAKHLKADLERNGVIVKISRTTDKAIDLNDKIKECNEFKANLAIDIHNNAGGGDGAEVFHHYAGGAGEIFANNILAEVQKIGQNSRGAKVKRNSSGKDYFAFIRETNCPAVLFEGAFLDNKTDIKIIDTEAERKTMAVAISKGIIKTLGLTYKAEEKKQATTTANNTDKLYRVQVGAFKDVNNAKALQQKLKAAGYEAIIV